MARKLIVPVGTRFGNLVIVKEHERYFHQGKPYRRFRCRCDCGRETVVRLSNLRTGLVKSCGCNKNYFSTHGLSSHPLYSRWTDIKKRCFTKTSQDYCLYGQRGIGMCDEWTNNFMAFYTWCMDNGFREDLQIDRIDFNGDYEPNNCRFVGTLEQSQNRRITRWLTFNGTRKTMMEWATEYGLSYYVLHGRIRSGWPIEQALSTPVGVRRKKPLAPP